MQTTSHLLMIRPVNFSFNAETAVNNAFQIASPAGEAQHQALQEFEGFVSLLRGNGVDVTVISDTPVPYTPDSIFPNNWISFHSDGTICLYPMFAENRRRERKQHVLDAIGQRFTIGKTIDLSGYEKEDRFLEGTGSMVLDRDNRIAYACLSPRTSPEVLEEYCRQMGYTANVFESVDGKGQPVYHTNVVMCVADEYVVICLESIENIVEQEHLARSFAKAGKKIIPITLDQMNQFAGNMLQVRNDKGEKLLIMSTQAYTSLRPEQVHQLSAYNRILHSPLNTIETAGGGSARCMLAEIYLEPR